MGKGRSSSDQYNPRHVQPSHHGEFRGGTYKTNSYNRIEQSLNVPGLRVLERYINCLPIPSITAALGLSRSCVVRRWCGNEIEQDDEKDRLSGERPSFLRQGFCVDSRPFAGFQGGVWCLQYIWGYRDVVIQAPPIQFRWTSYQGSRATTKRTGDVKRRVRNVVSAIVHYLL